MAIHSNFIFRRRFLTQIMAYRKICDLVSEIVGEEGCGAACTDSEIYQENGARPIFLCGFLEPWPLGQTLEEVEANLQEYTDQGLGLSAST